MPYPSPPGTRIAYHLDGTVGVYQDALRNVLDFFDGSLAYLNGERSALGFPTAINNNGSPARGDLGWVNRTTGPGNPDEEWVTLLFPSAIRLRGIGYFAAVLGSFANADSGAYNVSANKADVYSSTDSTNGVDGTWAYLGEVDSLRGSSAATSSLVETKNPYTGLVETRLQGPVPEHYRNTVAASGRGIVEFTGVGTRQVRALKFLPRQGVFSQGFSGYRAIAGAIQVHLYGEPDTNALEDRLELWRPEEDLRVSSSTLNWGDTPVGSSGDLTFRIKNMSPSKTATGVVVSAELLDVAPTPRPEGFLLFSTDGVSWTSTVEIGALSPLSVSGVIRLRRTTPLTAALGSWSPQISVDTASWV